MYATYIYIKKPIYIFEYKKRNIQIYAYEYAGNMHVIVPDPRPARSVRNLTATASRMPNMVCVHL